LVYDVALKGGGTEGAGRGRRGRRDGERTGEKEKGMEEKSYSI
jgi:hypothetical protein